MTTFNWLHLTDLHLGMNDSGGLWSEMQEAYFDDLKKLLKKQDVLQGEPLDLVLFTGDLVYSGSYGQYEEVNNVLKRLWTELEDMGYAQLPKLLAVPGNHDLARPEESTADNPDPALDTILHLWRSSEASHIRSAFWNNPDSPQRRVVREAFANYVEWWNDTPLPKPEVYSEGMLPGDFSATISKESAEGKVKLGILGLNSTFLQLAGGDYKGKLELHRSQFNRASGGNGSLWAKQHNLCLLLTHHPPTWLTEAARRKHLSDSIHRQPERFALHLFGHMHDAELTSFAEGGGDARNYLQGCSLFGLEEWEWGTEKGAEDNKRIHGYSVGQLQVEGGAAKFRIWPRKASSKQHWNLRKDSDFPGMSDDDLVTRPISVKCNKVDTAKPDPEPGRHPKRTGYDAAKYGWDNPGKFRDIDPTIDPILLARLDALQQSLTRIPVWLVADFENLKVEHRSRQELEGTAIAERIQNQLKALHALYDQLQEIVEKRNEAPSEEVQQQTEESLKGIWRGYASVSDEIQSMYGEQLDLIGGLYTPRSVRLNEKASVMTDLADELIRECAQEYVSKKWLYFTVSRRQEVLDKAIARIVRLRFPAWSVWNVPLAAHEFGHIIIEDDETLGRFASEQATKWSQDAEHISEALIGVYDLLIDTFATYMLGPAYVCAAISLRLDPLGPSSESKPTDLERADAMFTVLERIDTPEDIVERLRQQWQDACQRTASSEGLAGETQTANESTQADLEGLVNQALGTHLRWVFTGSGQYPRMGMNGLNVAMEWAEDWHGQLKGLSERNPKLSVPEVSSDSTLRDALNAAWLCRLKSDPDRVDLIGEVANELCKRIVKRRQAMPYLEPGGEVRFERFLGDLPVQ